MVASTFCLRFGAHVRTAYIHLLSTQNLEKVLPSAKACARQAMEEDRENNEKYSDLSWGLLSSKWPQ